MENDFLTLECSLGADELREKLRKWEPWSHRVDFSNGVSTKDCVQRVPFAESPLSKFRFVEDAIPFAEMSDCRLLDIGCSGGYNSIYAATKYGFSCTGIDVVQRHIDVSRFLADLADADAHFYIGSAETFNRPGEFEVVLHFGTLYHLPNPVLSLQQNFQNLRPGGYLGLETLVYDHPEDPNICYFMHMQNNDPTNFWALSRAVLANTLTLAGFREILEVKKVVPAQGLAEHMSRTVLVARKPQ